MYAFELRAISMGDNKDLARVIREVLVEMGVPKVGTAYADPELDRMYEAYLRPGACYWVVESQGQIKGGGGIGYLPKADPDICEVQKMYLSAETRGQGMGAALLETALDWARARGYGRAYIETMPYMKAAQKLYRRFGFEYIDGPLGDTGHYSCPVHMLKIL